MYKYIYIYIYTSICVYIVAWRSCKFGPYFRYLAHVSLLDAFHVEGPPCSPQFGLSFLMLRVFEFSNFELSKLYQ